jgi:AcrR family transcriptional regulator
MARRGNQGASGSSQIGKKRKKALAGDKNDDYRARRDELVRVAADVFNELGYEAATLNDIAEKFGTDRASVYYYVSGKEELLHAVIEETLQRNLAEAERVEKLDIDARDKLRMLIERLVDSYAETYPFSYVYIQHDMTKVAQTDSPWARTMMRRTHRFEKIMIGMIQQGVDEGIFDAEVPVVLSANSLFGMLNWTHRWFKPKGKWKASELADTFSRIFFRGIEKRT